MEDEYRIHRALLEELEKDASNSPEHDAYNEVESDALGVDQMSLNDDRGREEYRSEQNAPRRTSSSSPGKASVDVNKLLKNLPQKSDRSKSSESKPPVR